MGRDFFGFTRGKKIKLSVFAFVMIAGVFLYLMISPALAGKVYVNPEDDAIAVINNASSGDTIIFRPGTHEIIQMAAGYFDITVSDLTLTGEDLDSTIIDFGGMTSGFRANSAGNVIIENLTLANGDSYAVCFSDSPSCTARNNKIINCKGALYIKSGSNDCIFENNNAYNLGSQSYCIYIRGDSAQICSNNVSNVDSESAFLRIYSCDNVVIEDNIFKNVSGDSYGAFYIKSSSGDVTRNNTFQTDGSLFYFTSAGSSTFYLNDFITTTGGDMIGGSVTSEQKWTSDPDTIEYTYNSTEFSKILGNFWSVYNDNDLDDDGIIDSPYNVGESFGTDSAPLKQMISNYTGSVAGQTITTITIEPQSAEIGVGFSRTFTAVARDTNNIVVEGILFNWTSGNESVGTISSSGVFTAVATGSTTVKATNGSVFGTAEVTVSEPAAELTPVSIVSNDATPDSVHTYEVAVTGTNAGQLDAGAFNVTLFENGIGIANNSVEGVAAGGDFSTVFNWKPSVAGAVNLTAVLDSGGVVTEIDEFDNNISVEYDVAAPDLKIETFLSAVDDTDVLLHAPNNRYTVKISNWYGTADSGPFNISVWNSYTNETQVVSIDSISCSGDIQCTLFYVPLNFTPDTIVTFNATLSIDPENNIPDLDDTNNNATKTFTVIKNGYAGHRINGEDDIRTLRYWDINGSVTMSKGNSWYMTMGQFYNTFENNVTWQKSHLDIPENASIVEARLMLPYTWDYGGDFGNGFELTAPGHVNVTFNGVDKIYDKFYMDRNGWSAYNFPYGQFAYNVTDEFIRDDVNSATVRVDGGSERICPRGMILMVVYEDKSLPRKQIFYAEGFDLLIGEDQYFTTPEIATAYATFTGPDINPDEMTSASLIAMSTGADGLGKNDDRVNELLFNNLTVKNGMGTPLVPSEIAIATVDVTDYVKVNGNEAGGRDYADYIEPMNFLLIASYGEVEKENNYVKAENTGDSGSDDPLWAGTDRGRLSYKDTPTGEVKTSDEGKTLADFSVPAEDGKMSANIPKGTLTLDKNGAPVDRIEVENVDPVDIDSYDEGTFSFAGAAYECSPSGATFSPAIDLVFTFTADEWKQFDGMTPSVMYYNTKTKDWEEVETTYDPDTMTVTAKVTHFSKYAVFAKTPGAAVTSVATEKPVHQETPEAAGDQGSSGDGNEESSPASTAIFGLFIVGFVGICSFGAYKFKLSRTENKVFREK